MFHLHLYTWHTLTWEAITLQHFILCKCLWITLTWLIYMCISKISHSSHSHRFNVITVEFDLQRGGHGSLLCWLFSNVVMQWIKLHLVLPWWNQTLWYTCTMIALITINIFGSTSQSCSWIFIQTKFAWRCVNKYMYKKRFTSVSSIGTKTITNIMMCLLFGKLLTYESIMSSIMSTVHVDVQIMGLNIHTCIIIYWGDRISSTFLAVMACIFAVLQCSEPLPHVTMSLSLKSTLITQNFSVIYSITFIDWLLCNASSY